MMDQAFSVLLLMLLSSVALVGAQQLRTDAQGHLVLSDAFQEVTLQTLLSDIAALKAELAELKTKVHTNVKAITTAGIYTITLSLDENHQHTEATVHVEVGGGGGGGGGGDRTSACDTTTDGGTSRIERQGNDLLVATGGQKGTSPYYDSHGPTHGSGTVGAIKLVGQGGTGGRPGTDSTGSRNGVTGGHGGYASDTFDFTSDVTLQAVVGAGGEGNSCPNSGGKPGSDGFVIIRYPSTVSVSVTSN